jgi:hypothetical protein
MTRMDTNAGAAVEIWCPSVKQWRQEDIGHSMNIKGQPELYICFLGVTDCPSHSQLIGEEPILGSTAAKNKRKFEVDDGYESPFVQARYSTASTWLPSPTNSNLSTSQPYSHSISISPSPFSSMPSSPNFYSPSLPTTSSGNDWTPMSPSPSPGLLTLTSPLDTYDSLWAMGCVHIPENNGPWPSGMYARDMAWAFTHLQETCGDVETRFRQVFPGTSWVKATYYQHKDTFFGSTSSEIEKCRSLPRSAGGLWSNWKSTSTGWKKLAAKNKKSS